MIFLHVRDLPYRYLIENVNKFQLKSLSNHLKVEAWGKYLPQDTTSDLGRFSQ